MLRRIIDFYFLKTKYFFSQHKMMKSPSLEEKNILKHGRNLFRLNKLEKETNDAAMKDCKKPFYIRKIR